MHPGQDEWHRRLKEARLGFALIRRCIRRCDGQVQDKLDELQEKYDSETERRCLAESRASLHQFMIQVIARLDEKLNSETITGKLGQHWIL